MSLRVDRWRVVDCGYTTPCHLWNLALTPNGYGREWSANGKTDLAHRNAWIREHGPVPEHLRVLHRCDQRSCVNVDHLFLGTHALNMAERSRRNCTKLTWADVYEIRATSGVTQREIAERFAVSQATISKIRRGVMWSHETPLPRDGRRG